METQPLVPGAGAWSGDKALGTRLMETSIYRCANESFLQHFSQKCQAKQSELYTEDEKVFFLKLKVRKSL